MDARWTVSFNPNRAVCQLWPNSARTSVRPARLSHDELKLVRLLEQPLLESANVLLLDGGPQVFRSSLQRIAELRLLRRNTPDKRLVVG